MVIRALTCLVLAARVVHADEITIHADVTLQKRASSSSSTLLAIEAGETAEVISQRGEWLEVRVRGRTGWIPQESTIDLEVDAEPAEVAEVEETVEPEQVDEPAAVPERTIDLQIGAGLTVINQGFRTSGGAPSDSYNIGVTAATLALAGGYVHRVNDELVLGVELAYAYQKSLPGIRGTDPETGDAVTTAFSIHDVRAQLVAGYDFQRANGLVVSARAGVRYHLFAIAGVNPTMIPSEVQLAPTLGVGVALPTVTPKLGLRFALDTYTIGTQTKQTPGRRDGVGASATGATLQSVLAYRWKPGLDVRVTHDFGLEKIEFGAPDPMSARMHTGTSVVRFDVVHVLTIGIAKGF